MAGDKATRSAALSTVQSDDRFSSDPPDEARSSTHSVALGHVPALWIDRLLVATSELPALDGEEAVVRSMVQALADILPDCAVGACVVPADGGPQKIVKVFPGEERRSERVDPARLFTGWRHEKIVHIGAGGTTLHLACDGDVLEDEESAISYMMGRTALAIDRGLVFARAQTSAKAAAAELRALTAHMVQSEKLASLGQIAAGVVHELNNPLTSILAYTQYLSRKLTDPQDTERLSRISESATRMLRFTRDLVTYARPSAEVAVPVSMHHVLDQAVAFCEHLVAEVNASVERQYAGTLPPVAGKPEQLAQVFVNLITNACHAVPKQGGLLTIKTELIGTRVRITVADNGHGIASEHLGQIFTPFFTTKTDGRGTGLGLSIVRNIIDNHAGHVHAECDGHGARFIVELPVG